MYLDRVIGLDITITMCYDDPVKNQKRNINGVWQIAYMVSPQCLRKMQGIWKKLDLEATQEGWLDGDMEFKVAGTKSALVKFLKGSGLKPKDIAEEIKPSQQEGGAVWAEQSSL